MLEIEKMPTAVTTNNHPVHNWFHFVAGYAPEYVEMVIDAYTQKHKRKPEKIYDPFAGCATTCVAANYKGISSLGVERNPFFYKIGYTKIHASEAIKEIDDIYKDFQLIAQRNCSSAFIEDLSDSVKTFLIKLYDVHTLELLLQMREMVKTYSNMKYYMGFTFLSKILEYVTTAKTDGIYKAPTSKKKSLKINEAIDKAYMLITQGRGMIDKIDNKSEIHFDSSVGYEIEKEAYDLVIFGPPYLNNFDFAEMTRMQLYFGEDAASWAEISSRHRNHMLVNTTTALKLVKGYDEQQKLRSTLPIPLLQKIDPIVEDLAKIRKEKAGKKEYHLLIYPYLSQMRSVLQCCFEGLRPNGEIHIVVSDSAFYGIHIDTQEYLKDILFDIGFCDIEIVLMRNRGDRWILEKRKSSGKQLGEFEVTARRR